MQKPPNKAVIKKKKILPEKNSWKYLKSRTIKKTSKSQGEKHKKRINVLGTKICFLGTFCNSSKKN